MKFNLVATLLSKNELRSAKYKLGEIAIMSPLWKNLALSDSGQSSEVNSPETWVVIVTVYV
jgi:hypothetical protein